MALSWSARRQLLYYIVGLIVLALVLFFTYRTFFITTPSCFDNKQDGDETGIDCGGPCSLVCSDVARAPVVEWARSFQTAPSTYTAAAYIENPNIGSGAKNIGYSFQLFDSKNLLIIEKRGTTDLPPVQTIPIVDPNINVGSRTVARTLFTFFDVPTWYKVTSQTPTLRVTNQNLSADASRLQVTLENDTLTDAPNVNVAAVLFDSQGVARAASRSFVTLVGKKSSQDVVFTWPNGVPDIVRAEITVIPNF